MCRLFGLHAGATAARATFWLLDAPDSLAAQSHCNPDGTGIGAFDAGGVITVDKQPMAAWDDDAFASAARDLTGTTFVAHVRHASTGALTVNNTHPFQQDGRLFAHNGVVEGLDVLDRRLADLGVGSPGLGNLVQGDTDSERLFALITIEIRRHHGDVGGGIAAALEWVVANLPIYSVNFILTTRTDLWALRYPDTNQLWFLAQAGDSVHTMDARTDRIHARSADLARRPSVILASEPMNDDHGWQQLSSGDLVHVHADLTVQTQSLLPAPAAHQLTLADLTPDAATSQRSTP